MTRKELTVEDIDIERLGNRASDMTRYRAIQACLTNQRGNARRAMRGAGG
jgi:hypothetical protein